MIVFTVVERPEPLRPSRLTISPSPTSHVDAVQDVALAVVGVQTLEFKQARPPSDTASAACCSASTEPR